MTEAEIWSRILETDNLEELEDLLEKVVPNEAAREIFMNKVFEAIEESKVIHIDLTLHLK